MEPNTENFARFRYGHELTEEAYVVTVTRSGGVLPDSGVFSRVVCAAHKSIVADPAGADGIRTEVMPLPGRHVCARCAEFTSSTHARLVRALREPGTYVRRLGYRGARGIVYRYDSTSPSGARAAGAGFDAFCPYAAEVVNALAKAVEPPRQ